MIDEFRKEIVTVTGEKEPSQKELVELFTWECRQCHQKYLLKYRFEYYDGTQIMPKWRSLETDMINPDDYGLQGIVDCEYEAVYPDDVKCKCDRCGKEVKLIEANYKDYCDSHFRTIISKIGDIAHFEIICGKCLRDMFMSRMFKDDTDIKRIRPNGRIIIHGIICGGVKGVHFHAFSLKPETPGNDICK